MANLKDVLNVEGEAESSEEYYSSLQRMINSGMWGLQGSNGRAMMNAIEAGYCMLGVEPARDYWGNYIPSRSQVKAGTKGTRRFVAQQHGEEWAKFIEGVR